MALLSSESTASERTASHRGSKNGSSRKRKILWISVVSLAAWSLLAWGLAAALIVRVPLERADALVVMGGSATYIERTHRAADLYKEGRGPRVILTNDGQQGGWSVSQQRNPYFIERAREELQRQGVPADAIEELPQVLSSTHDEGIAIRELAQTRGWRSLQIVTSAYHSRRALWTLRRAFEGTNIEIGMESPPTGLQTPRPGLWWVSLKGWRMVAGEYLKFAYYWIRY